MSIDYEGVADHLAAKYAQQVESRIAAMTDAEKLRAQLAELQATHDHLLRQSRLTAEALVLAHERRDEALAEVAQLRRELLALEGGD